MNELKQAARGGDSMKPIAVTGLDLAFGGDMKKLMPKYETIPDGFKGFGSCKWSRFVGEWFCFGVKIGGIKAKEGIDKAAAINHLKAIMASWEPKHEHKEAAVAYLSSLWFEDDSTWEKAS